MAGPGPAPRGGPHACPPGAATDPILDSLFAITGLLTQHGENVARRLGLSPPVLMALIQLTRPMPMKDLGQKLGCERSFVTAIADELEQRALVRREPDLGDRRVKNLVLTRKGTALRGRLEREFFAALPWRHALDAQERAVLLGLLTKLLGRAPAASHQGPTALAPRAAGTP